MKIKFLIFSLLTCFNTVLLAQNQNTIISVFNTDSTITGNITAVFISDNGFISFQEFSQKISIKPELGINKVYFFGENNSFASHKSNFSKAIEKVYLLKTEIGQDLVIKSKTEESIEYLGLLDSLPEDYKVLEIQVLKENKVKRSGFNVQSVSKPQSYVDEEAIKTRYISKEETPLENGNSTTFDNSKIYYEVNTSQLSLESKSQLSQISLILNNEKKLKLSVKAYSDANQEFVNSNKLAEDRAENIINFLMSKGVSFSQLQVRIKGAKDLANGCYSKVECSELQHKENRVVQLQMEFE